MIFPYILPMYEYESSIAISYNWNIWMTPLSEDDFLEKPKGLKREDRKLKELWASLVAQLVKKLPAMRETRVWSMGQEDPLKKGMATHTSILVWRIPCQRSLVGYIHGVTKSQTQLND